MNPSRLAPLTGTAALILLVGALASDDLPDSRASASDLAAWFATHGTTTYLARTLVIALAGVLLLVFAAVLADRAAAAGASSTTVRVLQNAGTGWAVLTMTGGALSAAVPVTLAFYDPAPPSPEMYHFLSGAGYAVLVTVCAFAAALTALTLSVASLRTGLLPRWLTYAGLPAALLMLANLLLPMAVITLYFLAVSLVLVRRKAVRPAPGPATSLAAA